MNMIKIIIKTFLRFPQKIIISLFFVIEIVLSKLTSLQFAFSNREYLFKRFDDEIRQVVHNNGKLKLEFMLHTPKCLCLFRQESFSTKEPEMLEWIERFGGDGALYDIGANIGIYSIYYAKLKSGNVYSFEPSVFNLKQLAKNISVNSLSERITIIPNPLSQKTGIAKFINSNSDEGGALNAFGVAFGHDGKKIEKKIEYSVFGFALDDLLEQGVINEPPSLIKIDVDGIEHLILAGATKTLTEATCRSVFVEVNDDFSHQAEQVSQLLRNAGFSLLEKRHSEDVENSIKFGRTYNQIWVKS